MEKPLFLASHKTKQLVIRLDFMHVSLLINSCEIIVSSLSYFFVSSSIWQRFQNSLKASFIIQLYLLLKKIIQLYLPIVLFYRPETFFIENIKYYYYFLNKCLVWFVVPTYICKTVLLLWLKHAILWKTNFFTLCQSLYLRYYYFG